MSIRMKKVLSVLSVIFSLAAVGIGSGLITHDYSAAVRLLFVITKDNYCNPKYQQELHLEYQV